MSRCVACDKNLSDFESTRKIIHDDGKVIYPDLCNHCFSSSDLKHNNQVVERSDLATEMDVSDDEYEYQDDDKEVYIHFKGGLE